MTVRKRQRVVSEVGMTTPTTLKELGDVIKEIVSEDGITRDLSTVTITVEGSEIVFAYESEHNGSGTARTTRVPAAPAPDRPTPATVAAGRHGHPSGPHAAPHADADHGATIGGSEPVVLPFPTSADDPAPELTTKNAHEVVKYGGTFYFQLRADASTKEVNRTMMRPRTAAVSLRRNGGPEVLIETKRLPAKNRLQVTVVR